MNFLKAKGKKVFCKTCGVEFVQFSKIPNKKYLIRGKEYCSIECCNANLATIYDIYKNCKCVECGKTLHREQAVRGYDFCDIECYRKYLAKGGDMEGLKKPLAWNARLKDNKIKCAECGKIFVYKKGKTGIKYCSGECREFSRSRVKNKSMTKRQLENKAEGKFEIKICACCGKEFKRIMSTCTKYCSNKCRLKMRTKQYAEGYRRRREREKEQKKTFRFCRHCHGVIKDLSRKVYCSDKCKDLASTKRKELKKNTKNIA